MTRPKILELYKNYPEYIESSIENSDANAPIKIFEGEIILRHDLKELKIKECRLKQAKTK